MTGAQTQVQEDARGRPDSVWDGLRRGIRHDGIGEAVRNSLMLAGGGALLAVLLALMLTEAGRGRPWLDRFLLVLAFLPVAVPPMAFAVGWVTFFGASFAERLHTPILLMGARLLPFATFAVRSARLRLADEMLEAGAVAGLSPLRRTARITLPLVAPGAALGLLLAFLFGLREVDAIVFTRQGGMTLPVKLYSMIHYGYDVQVAGVSILWTVGIALFLGVIGLLVGRRFRFMP
jgi:ABC-type Fe3+ transport system permease subunit